jgi:hypothetical protein
VSIKNTIFVLITVCSSAVPGAAAISLVQAANASAHFTGTTQPYSLTCSFASPVTAGDTVIVVAGYGDTFAFPISGGVSSITDTGANSYTSVINTLGPHETTTGAFSFAPIVTGGSSFSVVVNWTFSFATTGNDMEATALCVEFSGMGTPSAFSNNSLGIDGTTGNSPVVLTLMDTFSNTVSVTFGGTASAGGPGVITFIGVVDMSAGGVNYMLPFIVDWAPGPVPTADHGYSFALAETVSAVTTINLFEPIILPNTIGHAIIDGPIAFLIP